MTTTGPSRVTARDVARAAGVSQATVSYVINANPNQKISEETRARVLKAVEELGYTPSAAARALRKGSSQVVLLVLPNVRIGPAIGELIERLEEELRAHELGLVTRRAAATDSVSALWREIMPAAVVSLLPIGKRDQEEIRAAGLFVAQSLLTPHPDETTLSVPQQLVGRLQVEHLATRGHRMIGYAKPDNPRLEQFLRLRVEGARMACFELGLDLPDEQAVPADAKAAERVVRAWRAADPPVTGVCAYNDEVAFVLLAGMRRAGLSAPDDIAVIGMDNIPLAPFAVPPLTTIDQNLGMAARHLAALVTAGIAGDPLPRMPRSESLTLVVRESA
jgi:DNA-binding LacI/PurR family transcriptional regulator